MVPNNELLAGRIRAGDVVALGEYLEARRARLLGFLRHITGEHLLKVIEVDDLYQEVSRSAVSALPKIPKEDLDIDRWLERLARRRVVDAHREHFGAEKRANSRQQVFSQIPNSSDSDSPGIEQLLIASMTSPSMAASRNWKLARMQKAISQLEPEQQTLLQLRFSEGLSTAEIAERLEKTDVAIRVALSRLLTKLQERLADKQ